MIIFLNAAYNMVKKRKKYDEIILDLWIIFFFCKILECECSGQRRRLIKHGFDHVFVGELRNVTKAAETV